MKAKIAQIEEIVSALTADEKQLLKDTINYGAWGDADNEFLDESGKVETSMSFGYCTNDAKMAGNFSGHRISAMFKSIYSKMCTNHHNQTGRYLSHCNDWWGDGSGDMLFIRTGFYQAFEEWART